MRRCSVCGWDHDTTTTLEWLACIHVNWWHYPPRDVRLTVERRIVLTRCNDECWRACLDVARSRRQVAA